MKSLNSLKTFPRKMNVYLQVYTLLFAQNLINIPPKSIEVIFNFYKSFMYHNNDPWVKKHLCVELDVTMGSHDSSGVCGRVELLMLKMLSKLFEKQTHRFIQRGGGSIF